MTSIKFRALTHDDHKLFFEALGEFGKDFQNIQQYMTQKGNKSKSEQSNNNRSVDQQERRDQDKKDEDKKREQIRNFYNKLYAKLSQLVGKLDDRVEKVNQELYLLINYGEIWKKHGFIFNNKTKRLLEDLLYQGSTTLRFKNKNVRLRTPPCRALKKINEIGVDEKVKVVTTRELPKDVIVEFRPATNRDWLKVQSISQNPRVRARLSIQKRLSNILEFMENKWNILQDKLNRTVDVWLKSDPKGQQSANLEDLMTQQQPNSALVNESIANNSTNNNNTASSTTLNSYGDNTTSSNVYQRLRLKPSYHHEIKEVNITRVVPDNHLDLSLTAYINRLGDTKKSSGGNSNSKFDAKLNLGTSESIGDNLDTAHTEFINSRLPISLTTPDCSILFEKSCTSDQPSIAQARKHLNLLQSLAGVFDGCESSRTACEDTQDRSLHSIMNHIGGSNHATSNHKNGLALQNDEYNPGNHPMEVTPTLLAGSIIPALYDEDAALPVSQSSQLISTNADHEAGSSHQQSSFDSQHSKSVEFNLPTNVTLGDYFKMTNEKVSGDNVINNDETANDAFPITINQSDSKVGASSSVETHVEENQQESPKDSIAGAQNHLVDIKRLAEGWTRLDDASMTIGELYLALKCPEKIILEYSFEHFTYENNVPSSENGLDAVLRRQESNHPNVNPVFESPSDDRLIFKLLTAASIALAQIERQKHEQQLKLRDQQQSCSKLKRRKVGPGTQSHNAMTLHDIEATNQRVEEALKQLQPTRLCSYRRAR